MLRLLGLLLLCGCSLFTTPSDQYDKIFTEPREEQLNAKFTSTDWRLPYDTSPDSQSRSTERNKLVQELMWLCDLDFQRYVANLYSSRTWSNIIGDIVIFGSSSAATLAAPGVATVLSSVSAGTAGLRGIVDSNVYVNETREAVISQMEALRVTAKADLYEKMSDPDEEWPLDLALMDLTSYSRSGSLREAVQSITMDAGTQRLNEQLRAKNALLQLGRPR